MARIKDITIMKKIKAEPKNIADYKITLYISINSHTIGMWNKPKLLKTTETSTANEMRCKV